MLKLTDHSIHRINSSLAQYNLPYSFASPIVNYLLYGLNPGGFFTSLLANDAMGAFTHSHPMNDMLSLKYLVTWINNNLNDKVHYGSYDTVNQWLNMSDIDRRKSLENANLIYDEQTEIMLILKD
jgi:hypothetical protein